jgi:hypothetical protein
VRGSRGVPVFGLWGGFENAGEREDGRQFSGVRGCSLQSSWRQGRVDSIPARSSSWSVPVALGIIDLLAAAMDPRSGSLKP